MVKRVLSYEETSVESPVNLVKLDGVLVELTDDGVTSVLWATVTAIGVEKLGFGSNKVSTHSVRASTVMVLLLVKVRALVIMPLGRWKSLAFTRYVRDQVLEAFSGLSFQMADQSDFSTETHKLSSDNIEDLRYHLVLSSVAAHSALRVASQKRPRSTPESSFNV